MRERERERDERERERDWYIIYAETDRMFARQGK